MANKPQPSHHHEQQNGQEKQLSQSKTQQLIRQGWDEVAVEYSKDRLGVFGTFAKRLLDLLRLPPGGSVLDVGCGSGVVALGAAERVGDGGHVTGCDLSPTMVSLAKQKANEQGAANVTFREMDAEQLAFPEESFDFVLCAFSLFQFTAIEKALSEMRRVLKPGGKLALSNWGPGYFSPVAALQRDLFRGYDLKPLLTNPIVFKPDNLQKRMLKTGFEKVKLFAEKKEFWAKNPAQLWAFNLDMGPFPIMLRRQLSPKQQVDLMHNFLDILQDLTTKKGIKCVFHPLYALAEKGANQPHNY